MMNMKDLRKAIYVSSQACTYYLDQGNTVLIGILRDKGYKYSGKLDEDTINKVDKKYRDITTLLNCTIGAEIIIFLYLFLFPFYTKIMSLLFVAVFVIALVSVLALYLTSLVYNKKYEKFLEQNIGKYELVKSCPNIYNVEPAAFEKYLKTPRKSVYVLILLLILFMLYAYTPAYIDSLNVNKKYAEVIKCSNAYLLFVPINSDVYAQRAYANYNLEKYNEAVKDYEKANSYSFSSSFDFEILGSKIKTMSKDEAIAEFDNLINSKEEEKYVDFLKYQKAIYLQQNKEYKEAFNIYNELISKYEKAQSDSFDAGLIYYNRGVIKAILGDTQGANLDKKRAKGLCNDCTFEPELKLVYRP